MPDYWWLWPTVAYLALAYPVNLFVIRWNLHWIHPGKFDRRENALSMFALSPISLPWALFWLTTESLGGWLTAEADKREGKP